MINCLVLGILIGALASPGRMAFAQDELVIVDWNPWIVKKSDNGFPAIRDGLIPLSINGDWTAPKDYARGLLHMRMEIRHMPVSKAMNWQWCFHQSGTRKEACSEKSPMISGPEDGEPAVITWLSRMENLFASGGPIDWNKPRSILNLVLRKGSSWGEYLSPYLSLNGGRRWAGENPDEWFPMEIRYTAVVVAPGATFSGWDHHLYRPNEALDAVWTHTLPVEILSHKTLEIEALVHLQRFSPDEDPLKLTADLSSLGGPKVVPLVALTDSTYRLGMPPLTIERSNGRGAVVVWIEQGAQRIRLVQEITILPLADQVVWLGGDAAHWTLDHNRNIAPASEIGLERYQDRPAQAFVGAPGNLAPWTLKFVAPTAVYPGGFQVLRFAFHSGDVEDGNLLDLMINESSAPIRAGPIDLLAARPGALGVDLQVKAWQIVEIPMDTLALAGPIESIRLVGDLAGTFYVDDLRLIAITPAPVTAVEEVHSASSPSSNDLAQNFPNPFNIEQPPPKVGGIEGRTESPYTG
jgi:hypothetical protein